MPSYVCGHCNYAWAVSDSKPKPKRCPYCDKTDRLVTKMSAQKMVRDVDSLFGE